MENRPPKNMKYKKEFLDIFFPPFFEPEKKKEEEEEEEVEEEISQVDVKLDGAALQTTPQC